jgi:hypothetical protein
MDREIKRNSDKYFYLYKSNLQTRCSANDSWGLEQSEHAGHTDV